MGEEIKICKLNLKTCKQKVSRLPNLAYLPNPKGHTYVKALVSVLKLLNIGMDF
jgi:hypothetical protein